MKNLEEVRAALSDVFESLKNGTITPVVATEMNNAAGKILKTVDLELKYYDLIKQVPNIPFIEGGSGEVRANIARITDAKQSIK